MEMNNFFSTSFSAPPFQTCDDHRGCHWRRGALLHPAGSARLLPPEAEEAQEEGDDEEDPARTRGGLLTELIISENFPKIPIGLYSWVSLAMR